MVSLLTINSVSEITTVPENIYFFTIRNNITRIVNRLITPMYPFRQWRQLKGKYQ